MGVLRRDMATTPTLNEYVDRHGSADPVPTDIVLSWSDSIDTPASAAVALGAAPYEQYSNLNRKILSEGSPATIKTRSGAYIAHVHGSDFSELLDETRSVIDRVDTDCTNVFIDGFESVGGSAREVRDRLSRLGEVLASRDISIMLIDADPSGSDVLAVDPGSDEFDVLLSALGLVDTASLSRHRAAIKSDIARWSDREYNGGRPPLGFEAVDGELVPASDYDEVCVTLEMVREGRMSKRKAASHLRTSARTITRCLEDRPELYGV